MEEEADVQYYYTDCTHTVQCDSTVFAVMYKMSL